MSAAMLLEAWRDTLVTTALLVLAILLIRKPFARQFGPGLAYALWVIPALRLILPPLPFAQPVAVPVAAAAPTTSDILYMLPADAATTVAAAAPPPLWSLADALPGLFVVWAIGMITVLVAALVSHQRFRREVLTDAVTLDPIGRIRLVMTDAVDGPVAFGLWHRYVAVPQDFFARYMIEERALAIDHELAHHRHGDLWANAAALLMLSVQWFNPFAWRAIRAFRFDQEAACDARVLALAEGGLDSAPRNVRAARYATAIAKAAVGSRLSLAAPMAVHDNLQERLTMLVQQDVSQKRGLVGRLLIGGATLAVLATTATLVPAGMASASVQDSDMPAPPAPPAAPDAPVAPVAPEAPAAPEAPDAVHRDERVMIFTSEDDGTSETVSTDGKKRDVRRIVIRNRDGSAPGHVMMIGDGTAPHARRVEFRMPGSLSRDDVLATLKEQGVTGQQAEAIADKLEAKRKESFRTALAPLPPLPPTAPLPPAAWSTANGKAIAIRHCADGKTPMPLVDRSDHDGGKRSHVVMMACGEGGKAARLSALKKARDRLAKGDATGHMSAETRAKVTADLDRAIAEAEKSDD